MKHLQLHKTGLLTICMLGVLLAGAQNFSLVKDVNTLTDSYPSNYNGITGADAYAVLNGIAYFTTSTAASNEIWRSDTATASVTLIKSFSANYYLSGLTAVNGKIYFYTYNNTTSLYDVYVSDGTPTGTKTLLTGLAYVNYGNFTKMGSYVYFETLGRQLWKTNGTAAGTTLVADFGTAAFNYSGGLFQLTALGSNLFFTLGLTGTGGGTVWKTDGTKAGTAMVVNTDTTDLYGLPSNLTVVGNNLYFAAYDGTIRGLWVTDGTKTKQVANPNNVWVDYGYYTATYNAYDSVYYVLPGSNFFFASSYASFNFKPFTVNNNIIYFVGGSYNFGYWDELGCYKITDTVTGLKFVADMNAGDFASYPDNITAFNGKVYFTFTDYTGDNLLYKTDGTAAGTLLVKDIDPGQTSDFADFTVANGELLFSHNDNAYGYELWKTNGTDSGTVLVKDIFAGIYSSAAANLTYLKGGITVFSANNGNNGNELWKTDGTAAGTVLLKDINTTLTSNSWAFASSNSAAVGNHVYFTAYTSKNGYEPYVTDGTSAGTKLVADLAPGSNNSYPDQYITLGKSVYFTAYVNNQYGIYKIDSGTNAVSTVVNLGYEGGTTKTIALMKATSNLLYFYVYIYTRQEYELWRTDGSAGGTYQIAEMPAPGFDFNPVAIGNTLYFTQSAIYFTPSGETSNTGCELWKTNGNAPQQVKDIYPGPTGSFPYSSTVYNGKLYFAANDPYGNNFLYASDGTEAGTKRVSSVVQVAYQYQTDLIVPANQKLYFPGTTTANGTELWWSDGISTAKMMKDIWPGPNSSSPSTLVAVGDLLYFFAADSLHGNELWKSNGLPAGTLLVKDIAPGFSGGYARGSYGYNFAIAGDKLYFLSTTFDDLYNIHDSLYVSDGTLAGTHAVKDNGLTGVSPLLGYYYNYSAGFQYYPMQVLNNKLYFAGYSDAKGAEFYGGILPAGTELEPKKVMEALTELENAKSTEFVASVFPNPVISSATLVVSGNKMPASVMLTNIGGQLLQLKTNLQPGTYSLNMSGYATGMYFITVSDGVTSKTMKVIKIQ